jgi:hypothetical protein
MSKKILLGLLLLASCFLVVGCGNKATNDLKNVVEKENKETNEESSEEPSIKLYSTDNKLVYNMSDIYFIVIDFDNSGNATGFKWIYDYGDITTAASMVAAIRANMEEATDIKSVSQDGKYIVVDYNESAYEGLTYETTKTAFSMYEQIEEQN